MNHSGHQKSHPYIQGGFFCPVLHPFVLQIEEKRVTSGERWLRRRSPTFSVTFSDEGGSAGFAFADDQFTPASDASPELSGNPKVPNRSVPPARS
jgi:hypothetical protein